MIYAGRCVCISYLTLYDASDTLIEDTYITFKDTIGATYYSRERGAELTWTFAS